MTNHTLWTANFSGIKPDDVFSIREELFDRPPQGESLDDVLWCHREIGGRKEARLPLEVRITHDDYPELHAGLWPPCVEGLDLHGDVFPVDVHLDLLPVATWPCKAAQSRKVRTVLWTPSSLLAPTLWRIPSQIGIATEPADQGGLQLGQRGEEGFVVEGTVGDNPDGKGSPGFYSTESLFGDLELGTEFFCRAGGFRPVELHPERERDRDPEELNDHGKNNPVMSPDETWPGPCSMVEENPGPEDVVSPFGGESVVHDDEDLGEIEALDDGLEEQVGEEFDIELELREKPVEVAFMTSVPCAGDEASHGALAFINNPRKVDGKEVGPAPFGEGDPESHNNTEEFRGILKSSQDQLSTSDNGALSEDRRSGLFSLRHSYSDSSGHFDFR